MKFYHGKSAEALYESVRGMPIIDYHCHLSPREILEDRPFEDLWEMWLSGDHYKWRLMRCAGIPEELITGDAPRYDKYFAFTEAIADAPLSPLYHWVHLELEQAFGITEPLCPESAARVWEAANAVIHERKLSPRKLLRRFGVEYVATTDDINGSLAAHETLKKIEGPVVAPTFRLDGLVLALRNGDASYLETLGALTNVPVSDSETLRAALSKRLAAFKTAGCALADTGVAFFPGDALTDGEADSAISAIRDGKAPDHETFLKLLGWLYLAVCPLFHREGITFQLHTGVMRDASTRLFEKVGADAGGDCIGEKARIADLRWLLDTLQRADGLPRTILYTLAPDYDGVASLIGAFPGVTLGAAWWFCDHRDGIEKQLRAYAALLPLGTFTGMLTDSRSFLSYVRHDYFRMILADVLGKEADDGRFPLTQAKSIMRKICYDNPKRLTEVTTK